jgi:phage tail tape-measure protein
LGGFEAAAVAVAAAALGGVEVVECNKEVVDGAVDVQVGEAIGGWVVDDNDDDGDGDDGEAVMAISMVAMTFSGHALKNNSHCESWSISDCNASSVIGGRAVEQMYVS